MRRITEMAIQNIAANDVSIECRMNDAVCGLIIEECNVRVEIAIRKQVSPSQTRHAAYKSHYRSMYFDLTIGPHCGHSSIQPSRS
jgi:hypothetical protein